MKQLIAQLREDGAYDIGWRTEEGEEFFTILGKLDLIRDYIRILRITEISEELEELLG